MSATLSMEIRFGDDEADGLRGAEVTWHAEGIDPDDVVPATLSAALGLVRMRMLDALREAMPMGNEEILDGIASSDARLLLLHTVMHLEDMPFSGMEAAI